MKKPNMFMGIIWTISFILNLIIWKPVQPLIHAITLFLLGLNYFIDAYVKGEFKCKNQNN